MRWLWVFSLALKRKRGKYYLFVKASRDGGDGAAP
jgi:hypothetical protein